MAGAPDPLVQFRNFVQELAPSAPEPVVLLKGEETFLKERAVEELLRAYRVPPACVRRLSGDEVDFQAVLAELSAGSLLAPGHRLVRLDRARNWASKNAGPLLDYLKAPARGVTFVLVFDPGGAAAAAASAADDDADGEEKEKASRKGLPAIEKLVGELGAVLACDRPREYQVPAWIQEQVAARGKRIGPDAVQMLVNRVGPNLALLDRQLEVLTTYVGERKTVETRDVQTLVGQDRGYDAFRLVQEVSAGRAAQALERLRSHLRDARDRGEFASLVGLLAWHYRRIYRARALLDAGRGPEIPGLLGIRIPKFVDEVVREAKQAPLTTWRRKLEILHEVDALEKTSAHPEDLLADLLVLRMVHGR
ncbi:MAG: DNA polymerase III subunit delta [Planctomycetes bacterium]|nr:DNA polymerase III subunit delta [Planctomycetota bacterium]